MSGAAEWWSDASTVSQTSKASPLIICLRAHPEDQVFSSSSFSRLIFVSCMLCVHRLSAMYEYIACQDFSIFTKRLARLETNNSLFPTQGQTLINCKAHLFSRLLCMYTQQLCASSACSSSGGVERFREYNFKQHLCCNQWVENICWKWKNVKTNIDDDDPWRC